MALPLEFHENFEAGTKGNFDSESDAGNRLDFPHQHDLGGMKPYRGAYCCRVNLGKISTDAYLEEGVSWASGQSRWGRFQLFVGHDVQFGNNFDHVRILQFYSSTSTKEASLILGRTDPLGMVLAVNEETDAFDADNSRLVIPVGQWVTVEWNKRVHSSAGVLSLAFPDVGFATSSYEADGTISKYRLGATDQTGDIVGTLYFDEFMVDEDQLYEDDSARNGALSGGSMFFVKSGFAFLGAGEVEHVSLVDGGSGGCTVKVYDADVPTALPFGSLKESLRTLSANATEQSRSRGFRVKRGCYVELAGTGAQALIRLGTVASDPATA